MPELPEVETTRRGIEPQLRGHIVTQMRVREPRLRWPVPRSLIEELPGQRIESVRRRAKYLLLDTAAGSALLHLGMSGSLRMVFSDTPPGAHDHIDIVLDTGRSLRFTDPRRFGSLLWTQGDPLAHPLLASLGPEPLESAFNGSYLHDRARGRRLAVKPFLMDSRIVVGIGNIYASEALFRAGIHPKRAAGRISLPRMERLAGAVTAVLHDALRAGGTTLRDYSDGEGSPGHFAQDLRVYGREGRACRRCRSPVRAITLGQRSTYYCARCQH
ncbi:MAG: bifunctional DNA-formamidopyrimidine glycosylase/DNA-(apurinic or apyrimidinic site) lyase [Gammaproteobacteria bacterium]|nr:bifunctional DNA-formamidopyrimidine glycosylase/DNA-(apurinic or apyrimidinic site) lyase [Gammaproteobacteria bacterium]